jgi:hypothetical protein
VPSIAHRILAISMSAEEKWRRSTKTEVGSLKRFMKFIMFG